MDLEEKWNQESRKKFQDKPPTQFHPHQKQKENKASGAGVGAKPKTISMRKVPKLVFILIPHSPKETKIKDKRRGRAGAGMELKKETKGNILILIPF